MNHRAKQILCLYKQIPHNQKNIFTHFPDPGPPPHGLLSLLNATMLLDLNSLPLEEEAEVDEEATFKQHKGQPREAENLQRLHVHVELPLI